MTNISGGGEYQFVAGINAPDVLLGGIINRGDPVFSNTRNVKIGLWIDQIVSVNQQSENFTMVGSLRMIWQDPALAFSPDKCNCAGKIMDLNGLKDLARENDIVLPLVTFFNQQGKRWLESQNILIEPSGRTTFFTKIPGFTS